MGDIEDAVLIAKAEHGIKARLLGRLNEERAKHYEAWRAIDDVLIIVKDELSDYSKVGE